jgi:hypothetical protein
MSLHPEPFIQPDDNCYGESAAHQDHRWEGTPDHETDDPLFSMVGNTRGDVLMVTVGLGYHDAGRMAT